MADNKRPEGMERITTPALAEALRSGVITMDQLEGTENRIAYARNLFNDTAKEYNATIRRFPNNIIAGMCGFERKPYFEAEEGANKAPTVEF